MEEKEKEMIETQRMVATKLGSTESRAVNIQQVKYLTYGSPVPCRQKIFKIRAVSTKNRHGANPDIYKHCFVEHLKKKGKKGRGCSYNFSS